jgi:hypothetical protein
MQAGFVVAVVFVDIGVKRPESTISVIPAE